jgi:hypothetical protein
VPGQRCRVVATGNPPISAEGAWVIKYWGPWLDPTHPHPAKPGKLRRFAVIDGSDKEVDRDHPNARSRTFIPARLEDNPDLLKTGYAAVIEGMPEPLRTMMREGRFDAEPPCWSGSSASRLKLGLTRPSIGQTLADDTSSDLGALAVVDAWRGAVVVAQTRH